ncbi:MAG: thioredoxin family protein [Flavobacteriaceae bacterium]|nr:thioredoxin family protein [Flavobacteriaceae bacterium]
MSMTTIKDALTKTLSFDEYLKLNELLVKAGSTTGEHHNESYANYTRLNFSRMKRLLKTVKLTAAQTACVRALNKSMTWLVISEAWCGDAAQNLPVLKIIADQNPNIELKIVLRDDNEELMEAFLTNGTKSIPKMILLDNESLEVIATWGPRPKEAAAMVRKEKEAKGKLDDAFKQELQKWYNQDGGVAVAHDVCEMLSELS